MASGCAGKLSARSVEARVHGSERDPELVCDCGRFHSLHFGHHEHQPLLRIHGVENGGEPSATFLLNGEGLGISFRIRRLSEVGFGGGLFVPSVCATPKSECHAKRDSVEPGRDACVAAKRSELLVDDDENLLHRVVEVQGVHAQALESPPHEIGMPIVNFEHREALRWGVTDHDGCTGHL
jgi:hypothetical protein